MKLTVAGTGYVGLVTGVCFAEKGHEVTCVDIDEQKVALMRSGVSPIYEAGLEELLKKNLAAGRLHFTTDYEGAYAAADAIFIGVGTPEQPDGSANLSYIATVCRQIAQCVTKDCLVVVKSTVPVGTNEKVEQFIKDNLVRDLKIRVASNPISGAGQRSARHTARHAHHYWHRGRGSGAAADPDLHAVRFADCLRFAAVGGDDQIRLQQFPGAEDFLYERHG
jgi:UDPglucose 6-dehydrogenase